MSPDVLKIFKTIKEMFPFLSEVKILKLAVKAYKLSNEKVFRSSSPVIYKSE
jgi:hypothetical protein